MLLLLLKLYAVQGGLFTKYERAAGASPIECVHMTSR